jgi:hypothetical protein
LEEVGVQFLLGKQAIVPTRVGNVQIIGLDYFHPGDSRRTDNVISVLHSNPPGADQVLRIVLLHDPGEI